MTYSTAPLTGCYWHPLTLNTSSIRSIEYSDAMLSFECKGGSYYAGQIGGTSRFDTSRPRSHGLSYHCAMARKRQDHWDAIYGTKGERDVSWFESLPAVSLELIEAAGLTPDTCVVDIGGGESRLVDALLGKGLDCLAVLDLSREALRHAQRRLGSASPAVTWIEADVTGAWSLKPMDIWHDRAVFHFLTDAGDRARYVAHSREVVKTGGSVIIATFAPDGPARCSGLPVTRYSPETLRAELGAGFVLVESRPHRHVTPWGAEQSFQYSRFRRAA